MNFRQESPANKYLESIHTAQSELARRYLTKDQFIAILRQVDRAARMDSDISEVEYGLIRAIFEIANGE